MSKEEGFAPIVLLLLVAGGALVVYFLATSGVLKLPANVQVPKLTTDSSKESSVGLKSEYKNPFDKNAQYVNPFAEYKNPFDNLKK